MIRRLLAAVLVGLVIGVATCYGQRRLGLHWQALANAASPWLLGAFVAGALQRHPGLGVAAGLLACLAEVAGFYGTVAHEGFTVGHAEVVFWSACAVVGGPLFGWAGWAWRHGSETARLVGAAALPATFVAEAVGTYYLTLHYRSDALLFVTVAAVLAVPLLAGQARWWRAAVPLVVITGAGIVAYGWVLQAASRAAFGV